MRASNSSPQSLEIARGVAFDPIRCADPRTSREAAWQAIERGDFSPDPSFGAGLDEFQFSDLVGEGQVIFSCTSRSGIFK
jgi:hypothetical protein